MPSLDLAEQEAIRRAVNEPLTACGLKKFFTNHETYYTEQSRNYLNVVPESLHQQAKNNVLAKQYAAMAKAWGTAWAELEKLVNG
jgi:ribosomal protein S20